MSYNTSEQNGGFSVLVPATTAALGSSGGVAGGFNFTTTGTAQLNYNGLVVALAAYTNALAAYGPGAQTQLFNQQIPPKNLGPSQGCAFVIACDNAATPNLYWFQGPVVDASQLTFPIPGPGSALSTSTTNPNFDNPEYNINVVPLLLFSIVTTGAQAYQVPGGPTLPTLTGVTNYAYTYASLTAPVQKVLCTWPGNSIV